MTAFVLTNGVVVVLLEVMVDGKVVEFDAGPFTPVLLL
jgi:hypothetical protein